MEINSPTVLHLVYREHIQKKTIICFDSSFYTWTILHVDFYIKTFTIKITF